MQKKLFIFLFLIFSLSIQAQENTTAEIFESHIEYLASEELEGRGLGTKGKVLAKNYIQDQFMAAGVKPYNESYFQDFEVRIGLAWVSGTNVIGIIEGSDENLKNEYIVLGAHYDHLGYTIGSGEKVIFPGADDNASGVAAIIELAKYFGKESNRPKRSLIFIAFDAEESGLLGASHFTSVLDEGERNNIKAMFSFDMVGMYSSNNTLDLKGIGTLKDGENIAKILSKDKNISLGNVSSNIERRTDTYPFGKIGIPSIHVFTGLKSPYHKPEDKYDLLDYDGMVKIHEYMSTLISDLAAREMLEPTSSFKNSAEFSGISESGKRSNKFNLGILINNGGGFHYYEEEFFKAKSLYKFSGGLMANLKLSRFMALQTELLYDFNGSRSPEGNFRRHSITTPLNLQIGTPSDIGIPVRAFVFAGGYYRYNFNGNNNGVELDFDNIYRRDEFGINWGIGLDIFKFQVSYTHRSALSEITQSHSMRFARENTISIGYRF